MFLRGQRVRVIESNAKGRTHPKVDDVGYINNLFLFPTERFILTSIFFCIYGDEQNRRMEHKKFILDLGMDTKMRKQISREGVNKLFFLEKNSVCLTPTFVKTYKKTTKKDTSRYVAQYFPEMVGTHGIWTSYTKPKDTKNRVKDNPFLIPCGNIADDHVVSKRLTNILYINEVEMASYLNSFGAMLSAMLQLYNDYYDRPYRSFNSYTEKGWDKLQSVMTIKTQLDGVYKFKVKSKGLSKKYNYESIFTTIQFMKALSYTALVRTEDSFLNNAISEDEAQMEFVRRLVRSEDLIDLLDPEMSVQYGVRRTQLGTLLPYVIYKILFTDRNTKVSTNRLHHLLGTRYYDCDKIIKEIKEIHREAGSNSAALNRLFGVINASKYDNIDSLWNQSYGEKTITINASRTGRTSSSSSSSSPTFYKGPKKPSSSPSFYKNLEKLNAEPEEVTREERLDEAVEVTREERHEADEADDFMEDDLFEEVYDDVAEEVPYLPQPVLKTEPKRTKRIKSATRTRHTKKVEKAVDDMWPSMEEHFPKEEIFSKETVLPKKEESFTDYIESLRKERKEKELIEEEKKEHKPTLEDMETVNDFFGEKKDRDLPF